MNRSVIGFFGLLILLTASLAEAQEKPARIEAGEADWIVLRFWVPAESAVGLLPAGFSPAPFVFDSSFIPASPALDDLYLWIVRGPLRLPVGGKPVEEARVVSAMLTLPVSHGSAGERGFFILSAWSDNSLLRTLLSAAGLSVAGLEGSLDSKTLPSLAQETTATITLESFSPWKLSLRSSESRQYDLGSDPLRFWFAREGGIGSISIRLEDGMYWRADSRIDGFSGNSPLQRLSGWRWADNHALLFYSAGATISLEQPPSK